MLDPGHPELRVGVLVWVQINGQLIFPKPVAIEKIHEREGKKWFFVEGSTTGLTADNLTLAATGADAPVPDAPMVEFALYYARRGWPVFPCKPTNKSPYIKGGLNAATTDQETIRSWWQRWPRAMIGVPMGSRSGVWAVDPDPPKKPEEPDGRAVWAGLLQEHGKLPATHTESYAAWRAACPVQMGPGPTGDEQPGRAWRGQNIDVRGEGGYVIVAPSVCIGRRQAKKWPGDCSEPLELLSLRHGAGLAVRSGADGRSEKPASDSRRQRSHRGQFEIVLTTASSSGARSTTSPFKSLTPGCPRFSAAPPVSAEHRRLSDLFRRSRARSRRGFVDLARWAQRTGAFGTLAMPSEASAAPSTS